MGRLLLLAVAFLVSLVATAQTSGPVLTATLQPEFGSAGDRFGQRVSISGDYAVVTGTTLSMWDPLQGNGEAYVLKRVTGGWVPMQRLRHEGERMWYWGSSAVIRDSLLFVGTISESPVRFSTGGFVNVYALVGDRWVLRQTLRAPGSGTNYMGRALAFDGERLVVGAPAAAGYQGRVYVYEREAEGWTLSATLVPPPGSGSFGEELALGDGHIAVHDGSYQVHVYAESEAGWAFQQTLAFSGPVTTQRGSALAFAGDQLLVGAPNEPALLGRVYVFDLADGVWTERQKLVDPGHNPQEHTGLFGASVAVQGDTLAVGAPLSDGHVALFARTGRDWAPVEVLTLEQSAFCDLPVPNCDHSAFGTSVAFDGRRLMVGAPETRYEVQNAGSVHVFNRAITGVWMPPMGVARGPRRSMHQFGRSVSVSGSHVALAASGSSYVYGTAGPRPVLQARLSASASPVDVALHGTRFVAAGPGGSMLYSLSGSVWGGTSLSSTAHAVEFDGVRMLMGRTGEGTVPGQSWVSEFDGTGWRSVAGFAGLVPDPGPTFGTEVALDGDRAYVGAPGIEAGPDAREGAVHVFEFDGQAWVYMMSLSSPDPALALAFGTAVAASGGRLLVGAPSATGVGTAWLFEGTGWTPTARFDGPTAGDGFGASVAIDGSRAIVGAPLASHPDAGTLAGQAHAYAFTGTDWIPLGTLSSANPRQNERFGTAVDVEGRRFAIGAPYPTPDAEDFGAVYLFTDATSVAAEEEAVAGARLVSPPVPNPASGAGAHIRLHLPEPDVVSATVVDVLGRTVQTIAEGETVSGAVEWRIETRTLAPGRYVVRVLGASFAESVALTVVR